MLTLPSPTRCLRGALLGATLLGLPAVQLLTAVPAHAASFDVATAEQRLFQDLNADRTAAGLPALAWSPTIAGIARDNPSSACGATVRGRSQDMLDRGYFAHQIPPCGVYVSAILSNAGLQWQAWGENIAWNTYGDPFQSADQANTAFMNDAAHRDNIMGAYNQVGIGVAWAASWSYSAGTFQNVVMFTEDFMNGPAPATTSSFTTYLAPLTVRTATSRPTTRALSRVQAIATAAMPQPSVTTTVAAPRPSVAATPATPPVAARPNPRSTSRRTLSRTRRHARRSFRVRASLRRSA